MSDGKRYYCFCSSNCKYETMTKEQILAAIAQAVETGSVGDCDTGFITKVKESNRGKCVSFWVGTQAQYNALAGKAENCVYIVTDDSTSADLKKTVEAMAANCAAAEAAASEAANAAKSAANAVTSLDISDRLAFSNVVSAGGKNLTRLEISGQHYVYIPAQKMVFYMFKLYYKGTMAKGERLRFLQRDANSESETIVGIYMPTDIGGMTYPMTANLGRMSGQYWNDGFWIYAEEDIDTGDVGSSVDFCGWYYCDGEG